MPFHVMPVHCFPISQVSFRELLPFIQPRTAIADCTSAFALRMYPSVKFREYAALKYTPDFVRPVPAATAEVKVPYEPKPKSAVAKGRTPTDAVLMFTLAPNAPAPFAEVPSPLWSCTEERSVDNEGIFTQKTSWDSESLRVMPLSVTFICEPLLPRTVILE